MSDTSVLLEWTMTASDSVNSSLAVELLKVQYQQRRGRWHTVDEDLEASARQLQVDQLKPGALSVCLSVSSLLLCLFVGAFC